MFDILTERPKNIRIVLGYEMLFIKIIQEAAYRSYILLLAVLAAFYELYNTVFDYLTPFSSRYSTKLLTILL